MTQQRFPIVAPETVGVDPERLAALFQRASREVDEGLLPSAQIAIARHGQLVGMRTFGQAQFQGKTAPATNDTLYCVFSATKAITSAAAWMLIEQGQLDIDQPVANLIPEFGARGKEAVRIEQLFTHTAGFPNAPFPPNLFLDREKRLEFFRRWKLEWEPGSRFIYHPSSSMYVVAELIERISGQTYADFVRERIALPLGLTDLRCGLPRNEHPRLADIEHVGTAPTASDYEAAGIPQPPETEVTEDALRSFNLPEVREAGIPGGGGTMTAAEIALFYQALLRDSEGSEGPGLWQPKTLQMARQIRSGDLRDPLFGNHANRALGLMIAGDKKRTFRGFGHGNSPEAFGHGGAGGQIAWADPVSGLSIGYCTNGHDRHPIRQARRSVSISSLAANCIIEGS
jgi:CubicO group peptidase (beta-lactamase class C family)